MASFIPAKTNAQDIVGLIESQDELDLSSVSGNFDGNLTGNVDGNVDGNASGFAFEKNIDPSRIVVVILSDSSKTSHTVPSGEIWKVWIATGRNTETPTKLQYNGNSIGEEQSGYIENHVIYAGGGDTFSVDSDADDFVGAWITGYKIEQ